MSKDNKKEAHPQPGEPERGVEFAHRRQVIRGLASIPVALTLSNGAAASGASSHVCLTQETQMPAKCEKDQNSLSDWVSIDTNQDPNEDPRFCVAYAVEDPNDGSLLITGYADNDQNRTTTGFVDQNGAEISANLNSHALRASCGGSFGLAVGTSPPP